MRAETVFNAYIASTRRFYLWHRDWEKVMRQRAKFDRRLRQYLRECECLRKDVTPRPGE